MVTANIHETTYSDVTDAKDLRIFVRRVLRRLPRPPDAVALQELWGRSAYKVARIFSRNTNAGYAVAVAAGDPPWSQPNPSHVIGSDTAIVVNTKKVRVGRSGYIKLGYNVSNAAPGREVRVKKHAYAMVRKRRASFAVPLVSVHFPKTEHFSSAETSRRVKGRWVRRINKRLGRAFSKGGLRRNRVIAGDINNPRCRRDKPLCSLTPAYRIATREYRYRDSVSAMNGWTNPIDFIFSKTPVVDSGVDPRPKKKHRYSDHVFRWALIENRDRTAPTPPGRISKTKGTERYVRLVGWKNVRDGGSGFAHFKIKKSHKGPNRGFHAIGKTRKTRFEDRKVKRGRKYWYRVVALDRAGNRRKSPTVKVRAGKPAKKSAKSQDGPRLDLPIRPGKLDGPDGDRSRVDHPAYEPPAIRADRRRYEKPG